MAKDIYTRQLNKNDDIVEVTDELSFIILQIETIFFTNKKEVIGNHKFGLNLEELLFSLNANEEQIKSAVLNQIFTYCPLAYKYKVEIDINFVQSNHKDVMILDVYINDQRTNTLIV